MDPLFAAKSAAIDKYDKYSDDIKDVHWKFQPLCFEATGGFDLAPRLLINKLAKSVANRYGVAVSVMLRRITNEISIAITRLTARMILRRDVDKEPLDV